MINLFKTGLHNHARTGVNLGLYPEPEQQSMINNLLNTSPKYKLSKKLKTMKTTKIKEKAKDLKIKASMEKLETREKFEKTSTFYYGSDTCFAYKHKDKSNVFMYELLGDGCEPQRIVVRRGHCILRTNTAYWNERKCVEFERWTIRNAYEAKIYTIYAEEGVFKVTKEFLNINLISVSEAIDFRTKYMLPIELLSNFKANNIRNLFEMRDGKK